MFERIRPETRSYGSADSGGDAGESLSKDAVFKMLSNRRRRLVVRYLQRQPDADESVRIRDLSEWIAAEENGVRPEDVTYKQRKRVYISLYQTHLPSLHANGIIAYDSRSGEVKLMPTARDFCRYLDVRVGRELGWAEFWVGLGAVCLALGVTTWLGVVPLLESRSDLALLSVSFVIFLSAVAFYRSSDQIRL